MTRRKQVGGGGGAESTTSLAEQFRSAQSDLVRHRQFIEQLDGLIRDEIVDQHRLRIEASRSERGREAIRLVDDIAVSRSAIGVAAAASFESAHCAAYEPFDASRSYNFDAGSVATIVSAGELTMAETFVEQIDQSGSLADRLLRSREWRGVADMFVEQSGSLDCKFAPVQVLGACTAVVFDTANLESAAALVEQIGFRALLASPPGALQLFASDSYAGGELLGALRKASAPVTAVTPNTAPTGTRDVVDAAAATSARLLTSVLEPGERLVDMWSDRQGPAPIPLTIIAARTLSSNEVDALNTIRRSARSTGAGIVVAVADPDSLAQLETDLVLEMADDAAVRRFKTAHWSVTLAMSPTGRATRAETLAVTDTLAQQIRDRPAAPFLLPDVLADVDPVGDADEFVEVVLGCDEAGRPVTQRIGSGDRCAVGALIVGISNAGKSTMLDSMLHSVAARYRPDDVEVWLLDLKQGAEFSSYIGDAGRPAYPHARYLGVRTDAVVAGAVVDYLAAETKRRNEIFGQISAKSNKPVRNLKELRAVSFETASSEPMPRIVAVIDEFQQMFTDDNTSRLWDQLQLIGRQGRSAGIHLVLATQSLAGVSKGHTTTGLQPLIDVALQLRVVLGETNSRKVSELIGTSTTLDGRGPKGMGVVYNHGDNETDPRKFRAALATPDDADSIRTQHQPLRPPIVYSGSPALSDISALAGYLTVGVQISVDGDRPSIPLSGGDRNNLLLTAPAPHLRRQALLGVAATLRHTPDAHCVFIDFEFDEPQHDVLRTINWIDRGGSSRCTLLNGAGDAERLVSELAAAITTNPAAAVFLTEMPPSDSKPLVGMVSELVSGPGVVVAATGPASISDFKLRPILDGIGWRAAGPGVRSDALAGLFGAYRPPFNVDGRRFWFADTRTGQPPEVIEVFAGVTDADLETEQAS